MLILSFELVDNPGHEYEVEILDIGYARRHLQKYQGLVVWASLCSEMGTELAGTSELI